jgi:hypothetical protein
LPDIQKLLYQTFFFKNIYSMVLKNYAFILVLNTLLLSCALTRSTSKKTNIDQLVQTKMSSLDSGRNNKPRPYKDVITSHAISRDGLFKIHKIDDRYFFEIPDSIFNRDILIVNRILKGPSLSRNSQTFFGYAGDELGKSVVRFIRGVNNKVFITQMSYVERSEDSSKNGLFQAVQNSNIPPILASFDIKAFGRDSGTVVVEMTDYLKTENELFFFNTFLKRKHGLVNFQSDRSFIKLIKTFPLNTEIQASRTYTVGNAGQSITYELNTSIVLLPKTPLRPRYADRRVGYFGFQYSSYDVSEGINPIQVINRWRLEPKRIDIEKYKKGDLVEPEKPIIFYIDPATPKKWVPYLIQGVNAWQKAFEKIGFKNAISALEAPVDDSTWSLDDARHSAIVYKASPITNANGPNISDPRSGEILESHISWYHNVMTLLHDWYMIQAGAIDPEARKMVFNDSLMGKLISYVCTHEVGHTLGLTHNMLASFSVPVEKLRDRNYLAKFGTCPSIMDYARFNYVAQPEDSVDVKDIIPRIGAYDEWAIEWGYKCFPEVANLAKEDEEVFMFKWTNDRLKNNKQLWCLQDFQALTDPRCTIEELGDDPIKASEYGIKNLKRILPQIVNWTDNPNEMGNLKLARVYESLERQFKLYIRHVSSLFGKFYGDPDPQYPDYKAPNLTCVSKEKLKQAVNFLNKEVFSDLEWLLMDTKIYSQLGDALPELTLLEIQENALKEVLSLQTLYLLDFSKQMFPEKAYDPAMFFHDLESGIWSEITNKKAVNQQRQRIQKAYAMQLVELLWPSSKVQMDYDIKFGINKIVKNQANLLLSKMKTSIPIYKDMSTKQHLEAVVQILNAGLDPNNKRHFSDNQNSSESITSWKEKIDKLNSTGGAYLINPNTFDGLLDCWGN